MPDSWGPSSTDIAYAAHSLHHANTEPREDLLLVSSDGESESEDFDEAGEDELMAEIEEVGYVNEYRFDSDSEDFEHWDEGHVPSSPLLY